MNTLIFGALGVGKTTVASSMQEVANRKGIVTNHYVYEGWARSEKVVYRQVEYDDDKLAVHSVNEASVERDLDDPKVDVIVEVRDDCRESLVEHLSNPTLAKFDRVIEIRVVMNELIKLIRRMCGEGR